MDRALLRLCWLLLLLLGFTSLQADTKSILATVDKSIRIRDYQSAIKQLKPLVQQNNATALFRMAGLYRSGKGTKQDADKAIIFYEKAALFGHAEAQFALASMLERRGADEDEIRQWYQASADQGNTQAIAKLKHLRTDQKVHPVNDDDIFDAVRRNQINRVKKLLAKGENLTIQDASQSSPLLVALLSGHEDMAALLLSKSKQANQADKNKTRPLHVATRKGYHNIVEKLISKDIDINAQDGLGNTALMIAVIDEHRRLIDLLLVNHADTTIRNRKQLTVIDLARTHDSLALFEKFGIETTPSQSVNIDTAAFEKSIRSSTSLYPGWPLLAIASHLGESPVVKQLLDEKADINATDQGGFTALHRAAANGQLDIVKLLLSKGARVDALNKRKETPLLLAATTGRYKTLQYLLKSSAKTTLLDSQQNSALSKAIQNQHAKSAKLLVKQPINKKSRHRTLILAIQNKMENIAIELSKHDPLIASADNKKRTPLWLATDLGLSKLVAVLLANTKVVKTLNLPDNLGYTALARATIANRISIINMLLKKGAHLDSQTQEKNSVLMLSILSGHVKLTEYYIAKGADIEHNNLAGDTAMMMAAANGENAIIDLLLKAGADLQRRNHDDLNAYQIALDAGHTKTATLIKSRSGTLFNLFN